MRRPAVALVLAVSIAAPSAADDEPGALKAEIRRLFVPLPVRDMFARDLEQELRLSRRDPFTRSAREELARARDAIKLRRAQIVTERAKREAFVRGLVATGNPHTGATLMTLFDRVLADRETASQNLERHVEALRRDINPGKDPGGHYWRTWAGGERAAAQAAVFAEDRLLDLIVASLADLPDDAVRAWFRKQVASHPEREIRTRLVHALASGKDPGAATVLRTVLAGERETWARTAIVHALAAGKPDGAKAAVLAALGDEAWPVRAATLSALWALDVRDAEVVSALVAALGREEGRLRLEVRDMLVRATGVTFGPDAAAWRDWWAKDGGPDWPALPKAAKVPPATGEGVSRCFGVLTTSRRIAFVVNGGAGMRSPATRRATGNDGRPSPDPKVDTSYAIGAWELEQALAELPADALFTVVLCGREARPWSKTLKSASKANRAKALRFVRKHAPDGAAAIAQGLEFALRIGQPKNLADPRYGTEAGVDTVFIVGGSNPVKGDVRPRMRSIRVVGVNVPALATK